MARSGPKPRNGSNSRAKSSKSSLWVGYTLAEHEPAGVRRQFQRLVKALKLAGTYDRTDPAVVATAARTLHLIAEADAEIDAKGLVIQSGNGTPMPNPAMGIRNALVMRFRAAMNDMGLTASSAKLGDAKAADEETEGGWGNLIKVS